MNEFNKREWSDFRKRFAETGKVTPEEFERLDSYQLYFVHQLKLLDKQLNNDNRQSKNTN